MSVREDWLTQAGTLIYNQIISPVAVMQEGDRWAVSCGWPSRHALSNYRRRVGECWPAKFCGDGLTRHIFISPLLHEPVEGNDDGVLPTLAHELIHATVRDSGHRGEFRRVALAIGMEGKMTESVAGRELSEKLNRIAQQLGPYPHAPLTPMDRQRKQSTRLIKATALNCTQCQYVVRTTRVWLVTYGPPRCPHGSVMVVEGLE